MRPYSFSRAQEVETNFVAVQYLARINIPPDALFDALAKLSAPGPEARLGDEWPSFARIHHLPETAADVGRLLDAGIFKPL